VARRRHVSKSKIEQDYYVERLYERGYLPTVEEELEFPQSDQPDEETSTIRSSRTRRSRSVRESISEHFRRNGSAWIICLLTLLVLLSFPAFWDIKGSIGRIEAIIDGIRRDMSRYETDLNKIEDKIHNQELKLQEQGTKIDSLGRK
jgi:hypothetical protein